VQVVEGAPTRLIKQILSIAPNQVDGSLYDVKFTTGGLYNRIGATPGSVLTVLDKLAFPAGINTRRRRLPAHHRPHRRGHQGHPGDPSDDATYPGVAAAGATVNVLGPLVKRIQVTLSVRIRSGASTQDIAARVKSAVASVINKTGIGQPHRALRPHDGGRQGRRGRLGGDDLAGGVGGVGPDQRPALREAAGPERGPGRAGQLRRRLASLAFFA
jgi:hypothetical protein